MEKQIALTIDPVPTKKAIYASGRTIAGYSRFRKFNTATMARILNGLYPHNDNLATEYQKILHCLKADGYLVEQRPAASAQAA